MPLDERERHEVSRRVIKIRMSECVEEWVLARAKVVECARSGICRIGGDERYIALRTWTHHILWLAEQHQKQRCRLALGAPRCDGSYVRQDRTDLALDDFRRHSVSAAVCRHTGWYVAFRAWREVDNGKP